MEVDNCETSYCLIREGPSSVHNSVLKLYQENILGRGSDATLAILSLYVSRKHCSIFLDDNNTWNIRDCGTLNGTYINDLRIQSFIDYRLNVGDRVGLGISMSSLTFEENADHENYYVYRLVCTNNNNNVDQFYDYGINDLCMDLSKF